MDRACSAQAEGPSRFDARRKSTHASNLPQVLHAQDLAPQISLPASPTLAKKGAASMRAARAKGIGMCGDSDGGGKRGVGEERE